MRLVRFALCRYAMLCVVMVYVRRPDMPPDVAGVSLPEDLLEPLRTPRKRDARSGRPRLGARPFRKAGLGARPFRKAGFGHNRHVPLMWSSYLVLQRQGFDGDGTCVVVSQLESFKRLHQTCLRRRVDDDEQRA